MFSLSRCQYVLADFPFLFSIANGKLHSSAKNFLPKFPLRTFTVIRMPFRVLSRENLELFPLAKSFLACSRRSSSRALASQRGNKSMKILNLIKSITLSFGCFSSGFVCQVLHRLVMLENGCDNWRNSFSPTAPVIYRWLSEIISNRRN